MDKQLQMLLRIKLSQEGPEFIEYLKDLSKDNYESFKRSAPELDEYHKGYAYAIDSLLECFEQCSKGQVNQELNDWHL